MTRRLREATLWAGAVLGLLALALGTAVTFFGFSLLVFRSGSMAPEIPTGGLALARTVPAGELAAGDVVSVMTSTGERVTHRVVSSTLREDEASLVLQGDANATPDGEIYQVTEADRVVASVPWGGYVLAHALTPPGLVAAGALGLMLVVLGFAPADAGTRDRDRDRDRPTRPGRSTDRPSHRAPGRRARRGTLVAAGVVAALAAVTIAVPGIRGVVPTLAAFTDQATTTTGAFGSRRFFTCDSAVRAVSGANPYLYWRFDETALVGGAAADSSGNGRPGVYQGLALASLGQARACGTRDTGSAVSLNGATQFVSQSNVAAVAGPNTFSTSIWFKTSANYAGGGRIFGFGDLRVSTTTANSGNYDRHVYMTTAGRLTFGVYPGSVQTVTSGAAYNDGNWHQVVATLGANGMHLYVDGVEVGTPLQGITTAQSFNGWWRVGNDNLNNWPNNPPNTYFGGTVDDFAVYTTQLNAGSVADLYAARL